MFSGMNEGIKDASQSLFDKDLKMMFHKPSPLGAPWVTLPLGSKTQTFQSSFPLEGLLVHLEK